MDAISNSGAKAKTSIYTREDAEFLTTAGVLPAQRTVGVETGGCPHTAIRDDVSMNALAIEELERREGPLELVFVESGGDNLAASFSPELVEASIYLGAVYVAAPVDLAPLADEIHEALTRGRPVLASASARVMGVCVVRVLCDGAPELYESLGHARALARQELGLAEAPGIA